MIQDQWPNSVLHATAPRFRLRRFGIFALLDGLHGIEYKILTTGLLGERSVVTQFAFSIDDVHVWRGSRTVILADFAAVVDQHGGFDVH